VTGVFLSLAIIAAVFSVGLRRWQQRRARQDRAGATIHRPVPVTRFDEIDLFLEGRVCACGGVYVPVGETSRSIGEHRFRIARLVCAECGREEFVYFDVTLALQ
jgi:hypothetical protein